MKSKKKERMLYLTGQQLENALFTIQEQSYETTPKNLSNQTSLQSLSNPSELNQPHNTQIPRFNNQISRMYFEKIVKEQNNYNQENRSSNSLNEEQKSTGTKRTPESQTSEEYSIPEEISVIYDQSSKCKHQHNLSDYQTTECSYEKMPYEYIIHQQQQGIQQQKLLKEQQNKEKIALQSFLAQTNKQVNIKYSSDNLDKQQKEQKKKFKKNVPF